jgi:hypothetical protein
LLNFSCYELLIVLSVRRDEAATTKVVRPLESTVENASITDERDANFTVQRKP